MNIYEYAMKVELDGEKYYRDLAEKSTDAGLKTVFTLLANQEVKHYAALKRMQRGDGFTLADYDTFTDEKTIYDTLNANKGKINFPTDEIEYYEEAIAHEDDMSTFYFEKAGEVDNEDEKNLLIQIAKEEAQHKEILENILEYIREPENMVGSAEF